ncbi:hypothetical protein DPM13_09305 [Paracoccus mutanolyticus]|uniref:Uncharacterized protein n=2 Tax=Paracoccus mutanolyticus TaxID=1499308 RepID=A0ABN5MDV1_9RHOB|nr:hypothetical protein DPM13_09305 [Paracoccus mutanolyticus]
MVNRMQLPDGVTPEKMKDLTRCVHLPPVSQDGFASLVPATRPMMDYQVEGMSRFFDIDRQDR